MAQVIVDGVGPDEDNSIPGLDQGDRANSIPPDSSLRTLHFRTIQSALHAIQNNLLSVPVTTITVTSFGPHLGDNPGVPVNVSSTISITQSLTLESNTTTPPVITGGQIPVRIGTSGNVVIRRFEITDGAQRGIFADNGSGTAGPTLIIEDSYIHDNRGTGIQVVRTDLTVRRTRVVDNTSGHGIAASMSSSVQVLENSSVSRNSENGIFVSDSREVSIEDAVVANNLQRGISVRNLFDDVVVRRSQIHDNGATGLRVRTVDKLEVDDIVLRQNGRYGLSASAINRLTVFDSEIESNADSGVRGDTILGLSIEASTIATNMGHGISLQAVPDIRIESNRIFGNDENGVFVLGPSQVEIIDNPEIHLNQLRGISLRDDVTGEISGNQVEQNSNGGISVRNSPAMVMIRDNQILGNRSSTIGAGIVSWEDSKPLIHANRIEGNVAMGSGGGIAISDAEATVGDDDPANANDLSTLR